MSPNTIPAIIKRKSYIFIEVSCHTSKNNDRVQKTNYKLRVSSYTLLPLRGILYSYLDKQYNPYLKDNNLHSFDPSRDIYDTHIKGDNNTH